MPRVKVYKAEFLDREGSVRHEHTFQALNKKEALQLAFDFKFWKLPYGSGKLKTRLIIIGKL